MLRDESLVIHHYWRVSDDISVVGEYAWTLGRVMAFHLCIGSQPGGFAQQPGTQSLPGSHHTWSWSGLENTCVVTLWETRHLKWWECLEMSLEIHCWFNMHGVVRRTLSKDAEGWQERLEWQQCQALKFKQREHSQKINNAWTLNNHRHHFQMKPFIRILLWLTLYHRFEPSLILIQMFAWTYSTHVRILWGENWSISLRKYTNNLDIRGKRAHCARWGE